LSIPPERARSAQTSDDAASVPPVAAQRAGRRDAAWEVVETIAIAVILFFVMRLLVLPVKVDGTSMLPSLTPDQHLLVNRRAYTHWEIGGHTYYLFGPPHRGDIIVLTPPPVELRQGIPFIKRIVGLPGDTVLVTGGKVLINGTPLGEPYIAEPPAYTWPANGQPLTVPPHNVVVFGDNRNHSEDSSRFGLLDESLIRGRAFFSFYPVREINFLPKPGYQ
jgi:signal peptidase I